MADANSLLIELGTEELPPKALDTLAAAFAAGIADGLIRRGIAADTGNAKVYCSPRRLAVWIGAVAPAQPDQVQERRGPAVTAGLDADGQPGKALLGFAQNCGVDVAALEQLHTDKGAWFVHRATRAGQSTAQLLPEIVAEAIKALPIPKPMRWGDHDYAFVRPVHSLLMLHGAQVVAGAILGVQSGRDSLGHRFHHPQPVSVADADSWLATLRGAYVLADPVERRARIRQQLDAELQRIRRDAGQDDMQVQVPDELLDEVANLTEWPVAIGCSFDPEFLVVPHEALSQTMRDNQKFFPIVDAAQRLTGHFIGIANIESREPLQIRKGYERVIRPRFADARFFYDEDRKQTLSAYQEDLRGVTYQQSLGSVWDKSVRVAELARVIANRLRDAGIDVDAAQATRAAALSKCDLMTRMVGEFPELQGVMGRYYAAQGEVPESAEVAQAIDEFYAPRFARDGIASGKVGQVLAVAERMDTLAGIFAVGMKPSGNKDPFALRRAALGLARTLIEGELDLNLPAHLSEALALIPESALAAGIGKAKGGETPADVGQRRVELATELYEFILDRLRGYYLDRGITAEAFEAVRAVVPSSLLDFDRRVRAVVAFEKLPEAAALAAANKRIGNILRQAGAGVQGAVDAALLEAGAEHTLDAAIKSAQADSVALVRDNDYVGLLRRLADLRDPVDSYFDQVMVMAEDPALRGNRLALLSSLRAMFLRVADISAL